ncbi:unnamed protein product [Brachionus calyciflorus]|uniref:Sterol regulatory element-binding protein cleavage-activating protein n=1 Tax=Brachionus calyciflorus TaxID=104777 RepID=A0A813QTF6_9BILA|nr:unnamed protein product [Brachionus calyciflorus]
MYPINKLKDYIGLIYYRHGLFCASHPIASLLLVFTVVFFCCYPLKNLQSFGSSLEQYKQQIDRFDGFEANTDFSEFIEFERSSDKPVWYNRVPIAYIQRIVVKSVLNIPKSKISSINETMKNIDKKNKKNALTKENKLFLIDAFRTPLAQLFELNDFIRNFQSSKEKKSLIGDMCVHVGELTKSDKLLNNKKSSNEFNKHYLPEFNCLYLSPANFWSNNFEEFVNDNDLMQTISDSPNYLQNLDPILTSQKEAENEEKTWSNFFVDLINYLTNDDYILDEKKSTNLKELLFGVSWSSTLKSLDDDNELRKKLMRKNPQQNDTKSIVMTYAITIALKKCDREFLDEFKKKLQEKFEIQEDLDQSIKEEDNHIYNLQYTRQSVIYYIPFALLYFLLFLYIYFSVRKIEFVKSKWGLALAAVAQVIASLLMSIGICSYFGLTPTLNGGEIFPYLIILIGFENIVVLTKSVVSTPFDLDVRYRIALGLKKESWLITKILTFELLIIFFGIITMVPAIQEFCIFAYVGLLIDFFMQIVYFVTVLSIDIRRMELSDLNRKMQNDNISQKDKVEDTKNFVLSKNSNVTYRGFNNKSNSNTHSSHHHHHKTHHNNKWYRYLNFIFGKNYANFLTNKSLQFFYFWANTRLVQRVVMLLTALWIILIFYKSLLVVELMRYDVNVKKETVEALLPKGVGFSKLFKDNFQQLIFTSNQNPVHNIKTANNFEETTSTFDNLKRHFQSLMLNNKQTNLTFDYGTSTISSYNTFESKKAFFLDDQNWQSLSYYHWLTLFAYYNISLYNRYVAILPQINLFTLISKNDILKYRNKNEIKNYDSFISIDNESSKFVLENSNDSTIGNIDHLFKEKSNNQDGEVKYAVYELMAIVIFGIPIIFLFVYLLTMLYKFLCSKNYEEWRKSWSTSTIRQKYKLIHSKSNRKKSKSINDSDHIYCDRLKEDCSECYSETDSDNFDNDSSPTSISKKKSSNNLLSELDSNKDDYINKVINGQQDEIDLIPFKTINLQNEKDKHEYPLDLIATSSSFLATSDISNQIKLWSLNDTESSDLIKTYSLNNQISVWSISISDDNKYIFLGFSNGLIKIINLNTNEVREHESKDSNGVTYIKELKSKKNNTDSFIQKNFNPENEIAYKILSSRLNGIIELIEFKLNKSSMIFSLRPHRSPITNLCYVSGGDYLMTTGQDYLLKIIKINWSNSKSSDMGLYEKDLKIMFESNDHGDCLITALCIDKENTINAASGSQDGTIFIWNLFTCEKLRVLNDIMNSKLKSPGIVKLELAQNLLISINSDNQMCIFNRIKGKLMREFKFLAPVLTSPNSQNSGESGDLNSTTDNCLNSVSGSILNVIVSGFFGLFQNLFFYNQNKHIQNLIKNDENLIFHQPVPSMCLYSKTILITGGCSCVFLWNIVKGELIKKINIRKNLTNRENLGNYSQANCIKEIKLIKQLDYLPRTLMNTKINKSNKLVLVSDYNDAIYVLKIPVNLMHDFEN